MAVYQNPDYVAQGKDAAFDLDHKPGAIAPFAGIYRCMVCHVEIGIAESHVLPPQNHHTHPQQAPIRWRLAVWADHNPK